jgi:hypothetical protein
VRSRVSSCQHTVERPPNAEWNGDQLRGDAAGERAGGVIGGGDVDNGEPNDSNSRLGTPPIESRAPARRYLTSDASVSAKTLRTRAYST